MRHLQARTYVNTKVLDGTGLTIATLDSGVIHTYNLLDTIDEQLIRNGSSRLAEIVELNNLSSIIGNILGAGIARASEGAFERNKPHAYPDLLAINKDSTNIEIKMALERNQPKGHIAKPGYYLTFRYVLGDADGRYVLGARGDVVWIWEIRIGYLSEHHFNFSNTEGDSGKTAVVNKAGMQELRVIYCDLERCPYPSSGATYRALYALYS